MLTQGLNFSAPRQYNVKGKVPFDTMVTRLGETAVQVTKIREIVRDGLTPNAPVQVYEGRKVQIGQYGDLVGHRWLFDTVQIAALKERVGRKQVPMQLDNVELALSGGEPGYVPVTNVEVKSLCTEVPRPAPVEPDWLTKVDSLPAPNLSRVVKNVRNAVECLPGMTITRKGANFSITVSGEGINDENIDQGFKLLDQAVADLETLSQDPTLVLSISGEVDNSTYEISIRLDSTQG
jgi:hypothetical protein